MGSRGWRYTSTVRVKDHGTTASLVRAPVHSVVVVPLVTARPM